ncbi:hypothetical protein [Coprococcus catus]|uniref:hypothetical protein n=1 Tax=Coprococcus catus TaxID=116085 RepID=UPI003D00A03A
MVLIYLSDLIPILISWVMFSVLAMAHRILIPAKYSAFLQFKEEENVNKTIQSTSIRIMYLVVGTSFLKLFLGYTEKQIGIGIFIACFLNIWPAIIQNQLLKLRKNRTEWLILCGYLLFIATSIFVEIMTIRLFIPLLKGDTTVYWLDNQAITMFFSLILLAFPVSVEAILSKFARIVVVQTIDTFVEEVYILEHQLNMEHPLIEENKFIIEKIARDNDVSVVLLETVLRLEIFYRGRKYNRMIERFICRFFPRIAIKKNISVGVAQIRISTAEEILRENPFNFIKKICDDKLNIEICARLLRNIINKYEDMKETGSYYCEDYEDIYDYIACEYLGAYAEQKDKTALIYSAVLRSFMREKKIYYMGAEQTGRCLVKIYKDKNPEIDYNDFQEFIEKIEGEVIIQKKVFIDSQELSLEFICDDQYYIGLANQFAKDNKFEFLVSEK